MKAIKIIMLLMLVTSAQPIQAQYKTTSDSMKHQSFPWPEGIRMALCLTFDDARLSQIDKGIPLLDRYQIKATFFISPDDCLERLEGWQKALQNGHEIGNHTFNHPCTGNFPFARHKALEDYDLAQIMQDIERANEFIRNMLQIEATSFAYPCGQTFVGRGKAVHSYVPIIAERFVCGRLWLGENSNDPWFCDPAQVLAMESDGKSFEELKYFIEQAANDGRWLILAGHEMDKAGPQTTLLATLEKLCEYVTQPEKGIWVGTVTEIGRYVLEHR